MGRAALTTSENYRDAALRFDYSVVSGAAARCACLLQDWKPAQQRIVSILLAIIFPAIVLADTRGACTQEQCIIEPNGPAAASKEVVLRALPDLSEIKKLCPAAENESTMFLSPYRTGGERFYDLQLSFLFGGASDSIGPLTTLYASYFPYQKDPNQPLLMVNYLAMRNEAWAEKVGSTFSKAPTDKAFSASAGRYVVILRSAADTGCLLPLQKLFEEKLKAAADQIGPEEPAGGPLKGIVFAQGTILDTLNPLGDEQSAAVSAYRNSLYALISGQALTKHGSAKVGEFPNLEVLSLGPTSLTAQDLEAIGTLKKLRNARLGGNNITDQMLAPLVSSVGLESLSLRANPITSEGVKHLEKLQNLKHLSLGKSKIDDHALDVIAKLPALRWLFLHDTAITDQGVSKLSSLSRLEYLSLNGTKVTDAVVESLAKFPSLRNVVLRETSVSPEGIMRLKQLRPNNFLIE